MAAQPGVTGSFNLDVPMDDDTHGQWEDAEQEALRDGVVEGLTFSRSLRTPHVLGRGTFGTVYQVGPIPT